MGDASPGIVPLRVIEKAAEHEPGQSSQLHPSVVSASVPAVASLNDEQKPIRCNRFSASQTGFVLMFSSQQQRSETMHWVWCAHV